MINKDKVREIAAEMEAALKSIIEKHGFESIRMAGAGIMSTSFKITFEVKTEGADSDSMKDILQLYGLPTNAIGLAIKLDNKNFRIVDVKTQNPSKPIIIEGTGGGRYKVSAAEVKQALRITPRPGTLIKREIPTELTAGTELSDVLKSKFNALASQLSPENISCDGELTRSQIAGRKGAIMSQWKALEGLAGRKVSFDEFPY